MPRPVLLIVWEARVWILAIAIVATAGGYALGVRAPKIYASRATILAPMETTRASAASMLGSLLNAAGATGGLGSVLGGTSNTTTADLFMLILRSRTLRERVTATMVEKHGRGVDDAVVGVLTETRDPGSLGLTVEATDPVLAAEFANEYFAELDRTLERHAEEKARRQHASYARQLERAAREVAAAERALMRFQTATRMILTPEALAGRETDAATAMRAAILDLERHRAVAADRLTPDHPDMQDLDTQIATLKDMYSRMLFGSPMDLPTESGGARKEFFVPAARIAPLLMEQLRVVRGLRIQEGFYTSALGGLEDIHYNSIKPVSRVEFVDRAVPPPEPVRPSLPFIVTAALVSSLVSASLLAILLDRLLQQRATTQSMPRVAGAAPLSAGARG